MKLLIIIANGIFLFGCASKDNASHKLVSVNHQWLDSIRQSGDTSYVKKYGTLKFANAEYFINRKDAIICQVMKDSSDSVRQIIITKNSRRNYFAEYYPNGQLIAQLPLDSFGQYHGSSKYYYQNGIIESVGDYKNGLKTGIWNNYDASGKLNSISEYDANGRVIKGAGK